MPQGVGAAHVAVGQAMNVSEMQAPTQLKAAVERPCKSVGLVQRWVRRTAHARRVEGCSW